MNDVVSDEFGPNTYKSEEPYIVLYILYIAIQLNPPHINYLLWTVGGSSEKKISTYDP